jgi:ATP synthase protein I
VRNEPDRSAREELKKVLRRDLAREARREEERDPFWRSLSLLGVVGWLIAVPTVGFALLGRLLDRHWDTGARYTLVLMTVGVLLGSFAAWRSIHQDPS